MTLGNGWVIIVNYWAYNFYQKSDAGGGDGPFSKRGGVPVRGDEFKRGGFDPSEHYA